MFHKILRGIENILVFFIFAALFSYNNPSFTGEVEKVRVYTRDIEFNYITWTANAALLKFRSASISSASAFSVESQKQIVTAYLQATKNVLDDENALQQIYADATITDKEAASKDLRAQLEQATTRQNELAPLAEAILQSQVSQVLEENGLSAFGETLPRVLFHSTPLPLALIVSPRDHIEQTANISVSTNLTVDQQDALENRVDKNLNVSSLVVPIGGVGVYPTMVMQTTNLPWLLTTISHEWTHNYLTLRPLGILYDASPELRTMNETTASIVGGEIGKIVLERYYPELNATSSDPTLNLVSLPFDHPEPGDFLRPPFDFRAEMHTTRVTVDALLAQGKINEAESYMEARRQVFVKNGYLIRKLNQAYFAFYGAYADIPGGAAGEDPVGPAVRALRAQSKSLADFVNRISWMTSFDQLKKAVNQPQ